MRKSIILTLSIFTLLVSTILPYSINFANATSEKQVQIKGTVVKLQKGLSSVPSKYGYIQAPNPLIDQEYSVPKTPGLLRATTFPTSYDTSTLNIYSSIPVWNQGVYGTCWAFASSGAAQSSIIKNGLSTSAISLSPRHLVWGVYNNKNYAYMNGFSKDNNTTVPYGGNRNLAALALSKGYGYQTESNFPYAGFSGTDTLKNNFSEIATSEYKLKNQIWLPEIWTGEKNSSGTITSYSYNSSATGPIKQALIDGYQVEISYLVGDESGYTSASFNWYNNLAPTETDSHISDHAVVIVGYDDSRVFESNGTNAPTTTGGWKIRNSWGSSFAVNGYFWMPYKEASLGTPTVINVEKSSTLSQTVQSYDDRGYTATYSANKSKSMTFANVYTAPSSSINEVYKLKSFSFYAMDIGQKDIFTFYNLTNGSKPLDGIKLSKTITITSMYPGYYTATLSTPLTIVPGTKYSIVDTVKSPSSSAKMPLEFKINGTVKDGPNYTDSVFSIKKGQSLFKQGTTWFDNTILGSNVGNTLITAYLEKAPASKPSTPKVSKITVGAKKMTVTLGKVPNGQKYKISYSLKKSSDFKTKEVSGTTKSLVIKSLKAKKVYYVKIQTYFKIGTTKYTSNWSSVKKSAKIK